MRLAASITTQSPNNAVALPALTRSEIYADAIASSPYEATRAQGATAIKSHVEGGGNFRGIFKIQARAKTGHIPNGAGDGAISRKNLRTLGHTGSGDSSPLLHLKDPFTPRR